MDYYKKDSLDIKNNPTYVFDINLNDTASFGSNRFALVIRQNPALGVHLLSFSAQKAKGGSQLAWTTENEANYTNFTAERSIDNGTTYSILGGFASNGQGTYGFVDSNPVAGTDMYRVKIQDLNGNISYTSVITLVYGTASTAVANNIDVYPNPSNGVINLAINQQAGNAPAGISALQNLAATPALTAPAAGSASYNIRIVSMTGSVVKIASSSSANWQDNLGDLTPGTYVIQVMNNKDNSLVGKSTFVKM
jgi:hypothetical protein